jgi:hypothetical protein
LQHKYASHHPENIAAYDLNESVDKSISKNLNAPLRVTVGENDPNVQSSAKQAELNSREERLKKLEDDLKNLLTTNVSKQMDGF